MSKHRRAQRWDDHEDTIDWARITPSTGSLATEEQPAETSGPTFTPLGLSRQTKAFVIRCEVTGCPWESAQESNVNACHARLLAHAQAQHRGSGPRWRDDYAALVDVRIRSRKYTFPIEVIDR